MVTQPPAPSQKEAEAGAEPPIFGPCLLWPNGCMDQDALGMEVGLGPVHIVLYGDIAPLLKKGAESPIFGPSLLWPKGWPLGMEVGLSPGDFVLDGDPAPYPKRGGAPPNFRPTFIVAKRLHGSRCHLVRR